MNEDEKKRIDDLEKKVSDIQEARDVSFSESIRKRVLEDIISAGVIDTTLTDLNETTSVPSGGGNVSHAEPYDRRLRVTIDGTDYYIGLYQV